jgi:hypothetical protein
MKVSGGRWWWGCNVYDRVSLANGNGIDLDELRTLL